jgi:hypothetical protein
MPESLGDREMDNWRWMTGIADLLGGDWPRLARETAISLCQGSAATDPIRLLLALRRIFAEQQATFLGTKALASLLDMTPERLANMLRPFGVAPVQVWRPDIGQQVRGYRLAELQPVFEEHLPRND